MEEVVVELIVVELLALELLALELIGDSSLAQALVTNSMTKLKNIREAVFV